MTNQPIRFAAFVALAGVVTACGSSASIISGNNPSTGGALTAGGTATNGGNSAAGGTNNGGNSTSSAGSGVGGNSQTGGLAGTSTTATGGNTSAGGGASSGGSSVTGGATNSTSTATGGAHTGGSGGQQSTTTGGSGAQGGQGTGGASSAVGGGSSATGGQSTGGATAWAPSAACVQKASTLYGTLTLAQRVGQMTQVNSTDTKGVTVTTSAVSSAYLGAMLSGGGTYPSATDISISAWSTLISGYLNAGKSFSPHVGMLFGLDSVHGNDKVAGAVMFPHNIGLGATRNEALVQNVASITAQEMLGIGANWAFAPAVAAARDIRWGRTYETFSSEPDLAGQLGAAAVRGLQGSKLSSTSVLACAKHFAGDGATDGGKNTGNVTLLDEATFRKVAVDPYRPSIAAGVGSIMPSYSSYQGAPLTDSKKWLTDVLKTELGFAGFLISDWDAVGRLTDTTDWNTQVANAVSAGIDMLMLSGGATGTSTTTAHTAADVASALTAFYNASQTNADRVKDAVNRILTIKCEMGLLDGDTNVNATLTSSIGSAAHRTVARDAVRQSLVVLKNDAAFLPLSSSLTHIHVTGSGADSLAKQCGGWTLGWQGMGATGPSSTLTGTTVLAAVKKRFTGTVTTSADGSGAAGADRAIVVVGEAPYAETQGDTKNGAAPTLSAADFAAIAAVKAANVPFVVVLFSGRPLILTDSGGVSALDESNAFIAAWLPGTEGDGIADVLFGDYKPTGKLSFEWPATASQIPLNVGDGQTPLVDLEGDVFAYGFGLTYP